MFFSRRKDRGPDLHLDWKVRIFFLGALLAFIGMILDSSVLVLVAIGVLMVGLVLRFLPAGGRPGTGRPESETPEDED